MVVKYRTFEPSHEDRISGILCTSTVFSVKKGVFMGNTRSFFIVAHVLFLLVGCGSSTSNTGTSVTPAQPSAATTATTQQHAHVGQTVKVGDKWEVTITNVHLRQGSQYIKPKAGMTWLVFSITAKNVSSQEQNISSELNFHLSDTTGQKYTE